MFDLIIIGGSAAGVAAAIYSARRNLKFTMLASDIGGEVATSGEIENYPGIPHTDGIELTEKFKAHLAAYNIKPEEGICVTALAKEGDTFAVTASKGECKIASERLERTGAPGADTLTYKAKAVIIATGVRPRELNMPGEKEYRNKGVSYCTVCLPPDAMIVGNNEPKAIETFKPKDRVLTHDGTYQKVISVMNRPYKGDLVQITSRFFLEDEVKLTPNHPVLVTTLEKGRPTDYWNFKWGEYSWLPAGALTKKYLLAYPIVKEVEDKTELNIGAVLKLPVENGYVRNISETHSAVRVPNLLKLDDDFFRLVGYYLAEGSINRYTTTFYFSKHEQAYTRDVRRLVEKYFGITAHLKYVGSVARIDVWVTIFSRLFDTLFSHLSYKKSLPHWVTILPLAKQKELIKGLWRGDGCRRYKDFTLVTNSKILTTQVKNILLRFGVIPSIRRIELKKLRSTKINGRTIHFRHPKYEITVGGPWLAKMAEVLDWDHPRLKTRRRVCAHAYIKDGFVLLPIRKIRRESYEGLVYNLAVDRNHSYVTTNSAVHNCDGPLFTGKDVAIIGGGNSANEAGIMLSTIARRVKVLTKNSEMKGDTILIEKLKTLANVEIIPNAQTTKVNGQRMVSSLEYLDTVSSKTKTLNVEGIFVHIGMIPNAQFVGPEVKKTPFGEIEVNMLTETNVSGLFAAGDVTNVPYKQISIAVGQGALAALRAVDYLNKLT